MAIFITENGLMISLYIPYQKKHMLNKNHHENEMKKVGPIKLTKQTIFKAGLFICLINF